MPEALPPRAVLLCPLAHEARSLRRHLHLPHPLPPRIILSGPGPAAVAHALETLARECPDHQSLLVILAGVAGGLAPVPPAPAIRAVITEDGATIPVGFTRPHAEQEERVAILGLNSPLTTPGQKQEWFERTGASLVDTESHAFALTCNRLNIPWAIARGVSDTSEETLPPQVMRWVDSHGALRPLRVAADLIRSPSLIPAVQRLGHRTSACLPLVAARVADLIRAWHAQGLDRA